MLRWPGGLTSSSAGRAWSQLNFGNVKCLYLTGGEAYAQSLVGDVGPEVSAVAAGGRPAQVTALHEIRTLPGAHPP